MVSVLCYYGISSGDAVRDKHPSSYTVGHIARERERERERKRERDGLLWWKPKADAIKYHEWVSAEVELRLGKVKGTRSRSGTKVYGRTCDSLGHTK